MRFNLKIETRADLRLFLVKLFTVLTSFFLLLKMGDVNLTYSKQGGLLLDTLSLFKQFFVALVWWPVYISLASTLAHMILEVVLPLKDKLKGVEVFFSTLIFLFLKYLEYSILVLVGVGLTLSVFLSL
ncbi:hypothetical protein A7M79_00945 [Acinetobacter baumannii]|nr:hypothetical protein A7M79_00945 [Acinetobacter baumannii]